MYDGRRTLPERCSTDVLRPINKENLPHPLAQAKIYFGNSRTNFGEWRGMCGKWMYLSVIVRKNRATAKDRGRPFTFIFSQYESYLKRLTTMAFGEVAVRSSSRYHYFEILGPPAT